MSVGVGRADMGVSMAIGEPGAELVAGTLGEGVTEVEGTVAKAVDFVVISSLFAFGGGLMALDCNAAALRPDKSKEAAVEVGDGVLADEDCVVAVLVLTGGSGFFFAGGFVGFTDSGGLLKKSKLIDSSNASASMPEVTPEEVPADLSSGVGWSLGIDLLVAGAEAVKTGEMHMGIEESGDTEPEGELEADSAAGVVVREVVAAEIGEATEAGVEDVVTGLATEAGIGLATDAGVTIGLST